ncbi:MAG: hypothetical protein C0P77_013270 [Thermoanaerobacterales bacterium]
MSRPDHDLSARVAAALHAEAERAPVGADPGGSLAAVRHRVRRHRRRRRVAVAGVAAVALAAALVVALPRGDEPGGDVATEATTTAPTTTEPPETAPPTPAIAEEAPATTAPSPPDGVDLLGHEPLWPFRSRAEADAWDPDAGHSPWHADAAATALFFTQNYLGFTGIDQVTLLDVREREAFVGVGYLPEPGAEPATAAVIHLVRYGERPDAPWVVVRTVDDRLTIDTPRPGAELGSPLVVGGTITGVDESVRVQLRQPSSPGPLAERCCVPAGGERAWWEVEVPFAPPADEVVTIVASSGGHVRDVEVFAVTGVRP